MQQPGISQPTEAESLPRQNFPPNSARQDSPPNSVPTRAPQDFTQNSDFLSQMKDQQNQVLHQMKEQQTQMMHQMNQQFQQMMQSLQQPQPPVYYQPQPNPHY